MSFLLKLANFHDADFLDGDLSSRRLFNAEIDFTKRSHANMLAFIVIV